MKIGNIGPTNSTSGTRRTEKKSAASGFADLLAPESAEATESSAISSAQPLSMMEALIAAQMVEDDGPKKRQIRHGEDLLNYLDSLRMDLLSGGISVVTAQNLAREVRAEIGNILDPRLAEILSEIETRAAVELAKVEMSAKKHLQD